MNTKKRCAVCGDTTALNVRLAWRRDRDGKTVNICCLCAESGKVNENSIDNFTTKDTLYNGDVKTERRKTMSDYHRKHGSVLNRRGNSIRRH